MTKQEYLLDLKKELNSCINQIENRWLEMEQDDQISEEDYQELNDIPYEVQKSISECIKKINSIES